MKFGLKGVQEIVCPLIHLGNIISKYTFENGRNCHIPVLKFALLVRLLWATRTRYVNMILCFTYSFPLFEDACSESSFLSF